VRRINLLPTEIAEKRKERQQVLLLVVVALVWLLVLGAVWFVRQGTLRDEEDRLAAAQAQIATLESQIGALEEFRLLDERVKAKQAALSLVMANDVHWSRLMIEFSMLVPGDSWVTSFTGSATAPADPTIGTNAPGPKYGSLGFSVVTFDFPGVARWLTRMQEMESIQSVWVPSAATGELGGREVVNFSSTSDLSSASLSGRFQGGAQ
jgi:Tfp pilus assembly protein PilN